MKDAVLNKMIELGDLLRKNDADAPMDETRLQKLVDEQTTGAAMAMSVLAYAPRVQSGETAGAYGERLLAEVRRRRAGQAEVSGG